MKRTILRWHLGLGDALLCNGLVRVLVQRGYNLLLPAYGYNAESVRQMFADLGDAVEVDTSGPLQYLDVRHFEHVAQVIILGHEGKDFDPDRWDESFYRQAEVPFLDKWEKFELPYMMPPAHAPELYFLHDDPVRRFIIPCSDESSVYRPDPTQPFWSHLPYLKAAAQIHCISSCFAILADLLPNLFAKRILHRYARPDGGALPIFGRQWTILDKSL